MPNNNQPEERKRRWLVPNKRAAGYASELKAKVHQRGKKVGQPLTDFEAGIRVGSLQMQNDHIGIYKYKKARGDGLSKEEAKAYSQEIGKPKTQEDIKPQEDKKSKEDKKEKSK